MIFLFCVFDVYSGKSKEPSFQEPRPTDCCISRGEGTFLQTIGNIRHAVDILKFIRQVAAATRPFAVHTAKACFAVYRPCSRHYYAPSP